MFSPSAKLGQSPGRHRCGPIALLAISFYLGAIAGCGGFSSRGLNSQGVRLFDQARYQDAIRLFQKAVDQDPANPDGYYNLAATYHRLGAANQSEADLGRAEQYYHLCLDRDANHRDGYRGLAVLLAERDRGEEAFRLIESWAARSPGLAEPKIEMARLLEEFGDKGAAAQQLVDAVAIDDTNPRALAALGRLREQMGDPAQALTAYQRSLWHDRFQSDVAARVASLQATMGPTVTGVGPGMTAPPSTPSGGTRTVISNTPTLR